MRSAPLRKAIAGLDGIEAGRLAFRSSCSGSLRFLLELATIMYTSVVVVSFGRVFLGKLPLSVSAQCRTAIEQGLYL